MTIPEGAVRQDQSVDIYLAVLRDDKDRPKLTGDLFSTSQNNLHNWSTPTLVDKLNWKIENNFEHHSFCLINKMMRKFRKVLSTVLIIERKKINHTKEHI